MLGLKFHKESKELAKLLGTRKEQILEELSEYSRNYFNTLLKSLAYNIQLSAILLEKVVAETKKNPEELSIVDYGGGIGITSLLAKAAGFKKVYYIDIFKPVYVDSQRIGHILGMPADQYIHGDIDDLVPIANDANALISRDVVEHIYDLDHFFRKCRQMTDCVYMAHNTSANIYNILLKSYFNKIHLKAEFEIIRETSKIKSGESETGYLEARKRIIANNFPLLSTEMVGNLATRTRGLNRNDIIKATNAAINEGVELPAILHPTNTCEPETGNWAERLLTFEEYRSFAKGYSVSFAPGPYNVLRSPGIKRYLLSILNIITIKLGYGPGLWSSIFIEMRRLP